MKRIFLTHIIPWKRVKDFRVAQAAHNFSYNLIKSDCFDEVYSIMPPNVCGKKEEFLDSSYKLIYSNLRLFPFLAKVSSVLEQLKLFFKLREECFLWLYNISPSNCVLILLLLMFKPQIRIFCIVLDYTPGTTQSKFMITLINKCKGLIKLSESDRFKVSNSICLPGIVPNYSAHKEIGLPINRSFLLSGVLKEHISMMSKVLDCFSKLPNCNLYITGFGGDSELINKYVSYCNNIYYLGKIDFESFVDLLERCSFVISSRDKEYPENECNFPSKILEAFLYNRIVLSTIEYHQIVGLKYFVLPSQPDKMLERISQISEMSDDLLLEYANQEALAKQLYSPKVWRESMSKIEKNCL